MLFQDNLQVQSTLQPNEEWFSRLQLKGKITVADTNNNNHHCNRAAVPLPNAVIQFSSNVADVSTNDASITGSHVSFMSAMTRSHIDEYTTQRTSSYLDGDAISTPRQYILHIHLRAPISVIANKTPLGVLPDVAKQVYRSIASRFRVGFRGMVPTPSEKRQ
jgi:hypothetical protein